MDINDVLGIGQLASENKEILLKFIQTCESGIGKLYEPTHVRRMAKAKAEEIKYISYASRENIDLPIFYSNGDIKIDTESIGELAIRAQMRVNNQEIQRQHNIESTIKNTFADIKTEVAISNEPVDKDWVTRFFNIVGDVNNEDMQLLWGKILSGEIKKPGTFSLRTLETIRNLSKEEAETFSKIANYVFDDGEEFFIYCDDEILKEEGIIFNDILLLDEAGIIFKTPLEYRFEFEDVDKLKQLIYGSKLISININEGINQDKPIPIAVYSLTKTGSEIFAILDKGFKKSYFENVSKKFFAHKNITLTIS